MREPHRWGISVSRSGYFQVSVITEKHKAELVALEAELQDLFHP